MFVCVSGGGGGDGGGGGGGGVGADRGFIQSTMG